MRAPARVRTVFPPLTGVAAVLLAGPALADITTIDALEFELRELWNQYPNSTLTVNNTPEGSLTGTLAIGTDVPGEFLRIEDNPLGQFVSHDGVDLFRANSHRAWFADNGGADRHEFDFQAGFDVSVDVQLNATVATPRLEAGFFFRHGTGADSQFIVKTFNDFPEVGDSSLGEIAAFGGPAPKASNLKTVQGPPGLEWEGLEYNAGETATLRMQYLPPVLDENTGAVIEPATMQYWYNGVTAYDEPEPFGDTGLQFLAPGTTFALKVQTQSTVPRGTPDTVTDPLYIFSNLVIRDPLAGADIIGDYNNSGQVEQADLDFVLQNWGDTDVSDVTAWVNFAGLPGGNIGGQVEQTELDLVLSNWGDTAAPDFSASAVPEPGAAAVLASAVWGLNISRRRRG